MVYLYKYQRANSESVEAGEKGEFGTREMCIILRDEDSGICATGSFHGLVTAGSQISVLQAGASSAPCCHWFTATPIPLISLFKPFIFCPMADIGTATRSPDYGDEDPAKLKPRFQKSVDREHPLYKSHKKLAELHDKEDPKGHLIIENLNELESKCMEDMEEILRNYDERSAMRVAPIFSHMAELEMNFYK